MRARAIAGVACGAALLAAVLVLRADVQPTAGELPPSPMSTTAALPPAWLTPPEELPLQRPERPPDWQSYPVPAGAFAATADPERLLVYLDKAAAVPGEPAGSLVVSARDGSGATKDYRPHAPGGWTGMAVVLDGAFYVVESAADGLMAFDGRLMRVDLASGLATQIQVRSVRLQPDLLPVGDELIVVGTSVNDQKEYCVIAIRPATGAERTVLCGRYYAPPTLSTADGGVLINQPDSTPQGCTVRLLTPGGSEFGDPVHVGTCNRGSIAVVGGWHAHLLQTGDPTVLLEASDGDDNLFLGMAKQTAVPCHGWLYWTAGGGDNDLNGLQVRRWQPGSDRIELVHEVHDAGLGRPTCTGGTLAVPVTSSVADNTLTGLQVLDRN